MGAIERKSARCCSLHTPAEVTSNDSRRAGKSGRSVLVEAWCPAWAARTDARTIHTAVSTQDRKVTLASDVYLSMVQFSTAALTRPVDPDDFGKT